MQSYVYAMKALGVFHILVDLIEVDCFDVVLFVVMVIVVVCAYTCVYACVSVCVCVCVCLCMCVPSAEHPDANADTFQT